MKKLLFLSALFIIACGFGQGEQLYADGTATDQNGNSFEWISYGSQDWAIENAEMVTYRDGTPIPEVTDNDEWANLTTGAWAYYNNDPTKHRLYNYYAVVGIHDNDESTPNKEFAPEGWHVPSDAEWTMLEEYLITNGYNYDQTTTGNKIAKSMASITGWDIISITGAVGNDPSSNNSSGFNCSPVSYRNFNGLFSCENCSANFWSSTENETDRGYLRTLLFYASYLQEADVKKQNGNSVRFVRDVSTASTENNQSNTITIYPNPTTSILTIKGNAEYNVKVYDITGRTIMTHKGNTIDMSNLSPATYIIKAVDNSNNEEFTYKVIKD